MERVSENPTEEREEDMEVHEDSSSVILPGKMMTQKLLIFRACYLLHWVNVVVLVLLFYCTSESKQKH